MFGKQNTFRKRLIRKTKGTKGRSQFWRHTLAIRDLVQFRFWLWWKIEFGTLNSIRKAKMYKNVQSVKRYSSLLTRLPLVKRLYDCVGVVCRRVLIATKATKIIFLNHVKISLYYGCILLVF